MNVIKTMKEMLKKRKKTLTPFQKGHIIICIKYVQDMKSGFKEAKETYTQSLRELNEGIEKEYR